MALKFIHTADWQLGARAHFIPGDAGARVRSARLEVVRRIGELARRESASFVVVAGDVFENHAVKPDTIRQALDAMRAGGVPFYLLPGNHDPYVTESIYHSPLWMRECPENVHVLGSTEPVVLSDQAVLLPCPLLERATLGDVTKHLTLEHGPTDRIRVGVAHGGIEEILHGLNDDEWTPSNVIPKDRAARARLDYLALGDWHGTLEIDERTWYSGAPEATRFKEKDPGNALVVEIDAPGAVPRVTRHRVASKTWRKERFTLNRAEDVDALDARLSAVEDARDTLLELELEGVLDEPLAQRLDDEVLARARDRLCFLRERRENLHSEFRPEDLEALNAAGWVGAVARRLQAGEGEASRDVAEHALRLLYRLHRDAEGRG